MSYDLATDPYVARKRLATAEVEAHAMNDAIDEYREWANVASSPTKLLREWGKKARKVS